MKIMMLTRGKTVVLALALIIFVVATATHNAAAAETRQVINASEILGNISRGEPVNIENAEIIGVLDVSDLWKDLEEIEVDDIPRRVVESEISIRNSAIKGTVNFNPIYFNDRVEFENVVFEGSASFFYAIFDKRTNFQGSNFTGRAEFGNAIFNDLVYFGSVDFRDASFWNATFNNATFFRFSTVYGNAVFDDAIFNKSADFTHFVVERDATFDNATFNDSVDFNWSTFNDAAWFKDAKFTGSAEFRWVNFDRLVNFENATFNAPVNFIQATFSDTASFQNASFNDKAYFILAKFKDRTYFTDAVFNASIDISEADIFLTMKIRWSQLDGKLVYDGYFYQSLLRNFETLGQSEDWRAAYYEYHVEKRKHLRSSFDRVVRRPIEYIFLDRSCGYGVKPLRPVGLAVSFILLFAVGYWKIEEKNEWENRNGFWNALFVSICVFNSLGKWSSKWSNWEYAKKHEKWFRRAVALEVFLGWILMVLFVVSLTLTWIR